MVDAGEAYQALCKNHIVIVTHCRLALQKNVAGLIDVIAAGAKNSLNIKWVIVGDGDLRNELTQQCDEQGIEYYAAWKNETWTEKKTLYFLGYQSNPFPFLSNAKLYVMSSDWEGFPLALCEALACSLPVITTDCYTGPREILSADQMVTPPVSQPFYAKYGVLMPLINNHTISIWVEEVRKLTAEENRQKYVARAQQRAKELVLESVLFEVKSLIDHISNE